MCNRTFRTCAKLAKRKIPLKKKRGKERIIFFMASFKKKKFLVQFSKIESEVLFEFL